VVGSANAAGTYRGYSVQLPSGWAFAPGGYFVVKGSSSITGIGVWDPTEVPTDPCLWRESLKRPGPTVGDLVEALLAQADRNPSTPREVTLAGYPGTYFEWSTPEDAVVTADADFEGCDDPGNGHHDFISWLGAGDSERYHQAAGQIDRLWILDVDGQRLVIDASTPRDAEQAELSELQQVVESLRFENR
jgi:hypothetical protein